MRRGWLPGLALLMAVLTAGTVSASRERRATEPAPEDAAGAARDEAFKMIDAYVLSNLQESLGLNDDAYVRLLPLVKRHHGERREWAQRRMQALMELRRQFRQGRATDLTVADLLKQVKKAEAEAPLTQARNQQAIDALLDPVQQAKYRIFEAEVERKVRELLRHAKNMRGGRGGSRDAEP